MKRLLVIFLLGAMLLVATGCSSQKAVSDKVSYASIIMPDGNVITGVCNGAYRISSGWAVITIDGVKYQTNEWRAVIWSE